MTRNYYIGVFFLCFFTWVILVDNAIIPGPNDMRNDPGTYTRYRIKKWSQGGKLDLVPDEILVYAIVHEREQIYYIESRPHFIAALDNLPAGTPVQIRYVRSFPKYWKRQLYDLRVGGGSAVSYSRFYLVEKQREIWKITGIAAGVFVLLAIVGMVSKKRT